jgi:hypothetical protein
LKHKPRNRQRSADYARCQHPWQADLQKNYLLRCGQRMMPKESSKDRSRRDPDSTGCEREQNGRSQGNSQQRDQQSEADPSLR